MAAAAVARSARCKNECRDRAFGAARGRLTVSELAVFVETPARNPAVLSSSARVTRGRSDRRERSGVGDRRHRFEIDDGSVRAHSVSEASAVMTDGNAGIRPELCRRSKVSLPLFPAFRGRFVSGQTFLRGRSSAFDCTALRQDADITMVVVEQS